ncbi:MAG: ParA family protein [Acutalibacteraceae bacterium]|nr:ParA family protein [Acutalibacteraceae bacterium]
MARIISVVNQKGGVGKTTTAVNLAAAFGLRGLKTLLIDIDPQGNTTSGLGIDKKSLTASSYDVLVNGGKTDDATIKTPFENLYVVPSSINLVGAEIEMIDLPDRHDVLKTAIALVAQKYDYILLDCPPALGLITLNALNASDRVLVPIQCEYFALEGLSQLMSTVRLVKTRYNPSLDLEGILFTMYDGRLNLTQQVVNEVKNFFPRKVFATFIPRSVRLSEAPSYGKPIQYYDSKNKGAIAYNALCDEILKRR